MEKGGLPRVEVMTDAAPPRGENTYQAIPESVEFRRLDFSPAGIKTIGLGRLAIAFYEESGELASLHCHVKTGRWKTQGVEPPPQPDCDASISFKGDYEEDFVYLPLEIAFLWHEESRSLHLVLAEGLALVIKAADCLLAGVDRAGGLTDIWMLDLDLTTL